MGPNAYSLVIEEGWPTANGSQVLGRHENPFTVSHALRTLPNLDSWTMEPPRRSTKDPLTIKFDRVFDRELLQRGIVVSDVGGHQIPGAISIENFEQAWVFTPTNAWRSEHVRIVVDTSLEDVAGNNFRELLDHSVNTIASSLTHKIVSLELKPSPAHNKANKVN